MNRKTLYYFLPLVIIFSLLIGWESSNLYYKDKLAEPAIPPTCPSAKRNIDLSLFWETWDLITQKYIDEKAIVVKNMIYGAIKGLADSLRDPYTVFLDPNETKDFELSLNGDLEGIGAELTIDNQSLTVVSVFRDTPAEKAGLRTNDIIFKINDEITSDMSLPEAIKKIRGPAGSTVKLTVLRKNIENPIELSIKRANIELESLSYTDKGSGIYYISINHFSDRTKNELNEITQKIILKEPKGIILDVRSNGGGYLDIAVDILSEFIKGKKTVVYIKKRGNENEPIQTDGSGRLGDMPLVILADTGSASASEILAGAVQDLERGIIIGEQTFGKGSVQEYEQFTDGSSLRITIAKWLTPNGKNIDEIGIKPDIEVKMTDDDYKNNKDRQLDEAVKYLKGIIK
ncbi:S41 family peptidase [Candidatus Peregrinibacteria bacterium]|nr:S41 family peptidase [Candidatus Peregrinibacteria bacterium]